MVDKPAGLVVHPAPSHRGPTLVDELGEILGGGGDPERPGIVHRLDKGTSGLLVVARDDDTHAALQAAVRAREVERVYLALAGGRLGSRTGTIDAPIGRASRQRHRMAVSGAASRQARTHFEVLELLPRESYLEARAGDRPHAPDPRPLRRDRPPADAATPPTAAPTRYGLERQFLHAHRLAFAHPRQRRAAELRVAAAGRPRRRRSRRPAPPSAAPSTIGRSETNPRPKANRILPGHHARSRRARAGALHHKPRRFTRCQRQASKSCSRPESTSATRRAAGTRTCAASSSASWTGSTSSTCCRPRRCWRTPAASPASSPAAAARCSSSAPRSRPATRSRNGPNAARCPTSTSAGWAAC